MTKTAWYLGCNADQVGEAAVLVGDRGRTLLAAEILEDAEVLNEDRGLTTATGSWRGTRITVSAFGMGAPIAAVVLHELAELGVRRFVRLGTVMSIGDTNLGDFVVAHGAVRGESTSSTYLPLEYPAVPDLELTRQLEAAVSAAGLPLRSGLYASYDGFYTDMFETGHGREGVLSRYQRLAETGVVAVDMESSAVFVAARALGVEAASLCLASVSGLTNEKVPRPERAEAERKLLEAGFDAIVNSAATA